MKFNSAEIDFMVLFKRYIILFGIGSLLAVLGCHRTTVQEMAVPITDEDGCASAIPVTFENGVFSHQGSLSGLADAAYFSFRNPSAGNWLLLETRNDDLRVPTFDPVITILSGDGSNRYASMDDGKLNQSMDTFFYHRLNAADQVCIKLESFERWTRSAPTVVDSAQRLNYVVQLSMNEEELSTYESATTDAANDEVSGSVPLSLHPVESVPGLIVGWVHGALSAAADGDRYVFVSTDVESIAELHLNIHGGTGNPSQGESGTGTSAEITVQILDETETLVAELIPGGGRQGLSFLPQADATYFIRVTGAPGWEPGANDFYSIRVVSQWLSEYPVETATPNDTIESAMDVQLTSDEFGYLSGTVMGQLESAGDVDFYRIGLTYGQVLMLQCAGASTGSGLENFTVSAFDENGTLVVEQTEGDVPVEWSDALSATGSELIAQADENVYLRISGSHMSSPISRFYYCYFFIVPDA